MNRHRVRAYDYIEHMLEAGRKALTYTTGKDLSAFLADTLLQDGVIRNFEVIGEAASQLLQVMPEAQTKFPALPLRTIISTRNRLIHGYNTLQLDLVWGIVEQNLPDLVAALAEILDSWPPEPAP